MVCFWVTIGVVILAAIVIFLKYRKFITYPILENPWEVPAVVEVKEVVTK